MDPEADSRPKKLTKAQVVLIKVALRAEKSDAEIAREFSVTRSTIGDIRHGLYWGWVA